jgi:hypothetical protein
MDDNFKKIEQAIFAMSQQIEALQLLLKEANQEIEKNRSYINKLEEDLEFYYCLEEAGVDNWSGIEYAIDLRDKRRKNHE